MAIFGRKNFRPPRRKKRLLRAVSALAVLGILGFTGWMGLSANTVHVRCADVVISDLPAAFDGVTVLFASDLDVCGLHSVNYIDHMFEQLQHLQPDLLLLGGDYANASLFRRLNGSSSVAENDARKALFAALSDFQAPLGRFAVSGDNDGSPEALELILNSSGFRLLDGRAEILTIDGQSIAIVGISDRTTDVSGIARRFSSDQCVLTLTHSPDEIVDIRIAEAENGGAWTDLVLAGHTHGGQVNLFGRSALSLTDVERRYLAGWFTDAAAPLLVSTGVGCEALNLRLGTQAEVWFITLKCPAADPAVFP